MNISSKWLKPLLVFSVSIPLFLLAGCFSSSGSSSDDDDAATTGFPVVTSTASVNASTSVETNIKVVAVFNKAMTASTLTQSSFTLQGVGESAIVDTVIYNTESMTATLTPNSNLTASTVYIATVTMAVTDASGAALASNFQWTFTTGDTPDITAPTVGSSTPVDGAIDVLRNTKVSVTFSEAIDPSVP